MIRTGPNLTAIKLRNVGQPQYYLAVVGGYFVGYVRMKFVITPLIGILKIVVIHVLMRAEKEE